MNATSTALLTAYTALTWPARALWLRRLAASGRVPVLIFNYHRIADDAANAWTCSHESFERQVDWLQRTHELVTLEEAQRRVRDGSATRAAHVTFDDGYASNCDRAIPLLLERRIPFTYFVSTRFVLGQEPFDHDVAMGHAFPPNTLAQLREIAVAGAEIGHHTRSHADLGRVADPAVLADELVVSRDELAQRLGSRVRYFAFAFGQPENITDVAIDLARASGYECVVSNYGGYNFPRRDPFHLQRHHVVDGLARLRNHASIDPRKLAVTTDLVRRTARTA